MMFRFKYSGGIFVGYHDRTGEMFTIVEPKYVLRFYSFRIIEWKAPTLFDILLNESCNGKTMRVQKAYKI